jgi:ligand-binding sensor domain-containing protein
MNISSVFGQMTALESITMEDGLSQGMVFDIAKDQDGFMWFATKNGLNRYDGYNFKVFNNTPYDSTSLPFSSIHKLLVDSQNRLWVNSSFLYDRNLEIFYNINKKIKGLIEDKDGNLWCFIDKTIYQLKVLESKNKEAPLFQLETKATLTATIYVLKGLSDGTILVGTREDGLFKLNIKTIQVSSLFRNIRAVQNIIEYPKGTIWISGKKFYRIQNETLDTITLMLNQQVYDFGEKKIRLNSTTEKIWFQGGSRRIMYEIDPFQSKTAYDLDKVEKIVLEDTKLYPINFYFEENRALWIGTNGYGIRKISLQ